MTTQEALSLLEQLKLIFDIVRLVDVTMTRQLSLSSNGELVSEPYSCYAVWNKTSRCDNCISAKAFSCKERLSKFEFVDNDIYHVIAKYIEVDDRACILELVSKITDKSLIGAYGKNEFIEAISNYNHKLYTDALTGAYNRYYCDEQLLGLASIEALAMIDVDNFKRINDTYGHLAGDASLCAIVKAISTSLRSSDKIIRYGGDEFMLVFANIPKKVFGEKLEQIRQKVSETSIAEAPDIHLTVSIGAVCERMPVPEALRVADQMLYAAKTVKNSIRMKEPSDVPAC